MKSRVITAVLLLVAVMALLLLPRPEPAGIAIAALGCISLAELAGILNASKILAAFGGLMLLALVAWPIPWLLLALLPPLLYGLLKQDGNLRFGLLQVWICLPLALLYRSHCLAFEPVVTLARPILGMLIPVWAGDTAAIFVGKAFGKHLLAPKISPKKTVEGAIGSAIASIAVAFALAPVLHYLSTLAAIYGLSAAILGQLGDLFESALKRKAEVKDSGSILPGHGGVLDRIDGLLFAIVPSTLAYLYLR
ncbi:MAG: phosphatidate cytidylyltransferase [Armatimonadetes bacterium]|nr:phosphatidate cytidylyltransferase [Armatimonadota bacterium]